MKSLSSALVCLVLAGCALFHSPPAAASTLTVTWTNPTLNTDDTPIPATGGESLNSWRIEYGTCAAPNVFGVKAGEFVRTRAPGGPPLTTATNNVPTGLTCARVFVANVAAKESDASNVASKAVEASTPKPPTGALAP